MRVLFSAFQHECYPTIALSWRYYSIRRTYIHPVTHCPHLLLRFFRRSQIVFLLLYCVPVDFVLLLLFWLHAPSALDLDVDTVGVTVLPNMRSVYTCTCTVFTVSSGSSPHRSKEVAGATLCGQEIMVGKVKAHEWCGNNANVLVFTS